MTTDYISLETLAAQIGLPQKYLRDLTASRQIPSLDTGSGRLRFKEKAVRDALAGIEQQSVKTPNTINTAETPRRLLHFAPVCKGSSPNDIRTAQAELCRHEIGVKIDGEFGRQTAMGICELLVKIENGCGFHPLSRQKKPQPATRADRGEQGMSKPKDFTKIFPKSLLKKGDPDNYLTRIMRWLRRNR